MNRTTHDREQLPPDRRGAILIIAMMAMLFATIVGAALLKTALAQRRFSRNEQLRLQSQWLAESGLERAAAKLAKDAGYREETWKISAKDFGGRHAGEVTIRVAVDKNNSSRRVVTAVATFPMGTAQRSRTTRTIIIDLNRYSKTP